MSYDKNVGNQEVKFKDEKSYLNCRLDYLEYCSNVVPPVDFLEFIQDVMYDTEKSEVESIEPIQYVGEGNQGIGGWDQTPVETSNISFNDNLGQGGFTTIGVDMASSSLSESHTYSTWYNGTTGDVHISSNLIIDGTLTVDGEIYNSPINTSHKPDPPIEIPKVEPPEDPIDNRFDILDL